MTHQCRSKQDMALLWIRDQPLAWFRDAPIDMRDIDLIRAERVAWLDYSKRSYLRKVYHMKAGDAFEAVRACLRDNTPVPSSTELLPVTLTTTPAYT
ncbi:hypothetical protein CLCR_07773 [Cladophialophora carrionii]|uniref:Uncharacterized protein n=1 Tax=Cladophialophora carrionii TaxID=86049 RepID=A0A1C1CP71_9EURO|nr:hypothetical protein CLCR_07773 [Cladophialophora carrionii]